MRVGRNIQIIFFTERQQKSSTGHRLPYENGIHCNNNKHCEWVLHRGHSARHWRYLVWRYRCCRDFIKIHKVPERAYFEILSTLSAYKVPASQFLFFSTSLHWPSHVRHHRRYRTNGTKWIGDFTLWHIAFKPKVSINHLTKTFIRLHFAISGWLRFGVLN